MLSGWLLHSCGFLHTRVTVWRICKHLNAMCSYCLCVYCILTHMRVHIWSCMYVLELRCLSSTELSSSPWQHGGVRLKSPIFHLVPGDIRKLGGKLHNVICIRLHNSMTNSVGSLVTILNIASLKKNKKKSSFNHGCLLGRWEQVRKELDTFNSFFIHYV